MWHLFRRLNIPQTYRNLLEATKKNSAPEEMKSGAQNYAILIFVENNSKPLTTKPRYKKKIWITDYESQ